MQASLRWYIIVDFYMYLELPHIFVDPFSHYKGKDWQTKLGPPQLTWWCSLQLWGGDSPHEPPQWAQEVDEVAQLSVGPQVPHPGRETTLWTHGVTPSKGIKDTCSGEGKDQKQCHTEWPQAEETLILLFYRIYNSMTIVHTKKPWYNYNI